MVEVLKSIYYLLAIAALIAAITAIWAANVERSEPGAKTFTYTEGGYECTVLLTSGTATCKEKE